MDVEFVLEVEGLNKSFPGAAFRSSKRVLHDVQFRVRRQRTTGFIGVNGSGKTTTLKCLLGFIRPDQGSARLMGLNAHDPLARQRLGYLPERPYLYEFLTAKEFLHFHWQLTGGGRGFEDAAQRVLERVNLAPAMNSRIRTFSKGMMQRVGFAQALLRSPDLLILDEPMSGLDPDGRFLMKEILREEHKGGRTLFFSTHYLSDVEELCEDIVVIDQGRILYHGATAELLGKNSSRIRVTALAQGTQAPFEIIVEQQELAAKLEEIQTSGGRVVAINNEFVALEVAFKSLRGAKDSGS